MAVTFENPEKLIGFFDELSQIGKKGQFSEQMKLPKPKPPAALGAFGGLGTVPTTYTGGTGATALPGGDIGRLMRAIRGQESGGQRNPYGAVNPHSGAMGAYQVMPSNITGRHSGWDWDALGRDVSRQEFMSNPGIQDAIARHRLGIYLQNYGMAGAAATWYGGEWGRKNMYSKKPQAGYPSMYDYVMSILNRAG